MRRGRADSGGSDGAIDVATAPAGCLWCGVTWADSSSTARGATPVARPVPSAPGAWSPARLAPLLAALAAFTLYVVTLHPGLPAGDSGELITVVATGGVAHPPGYPLYTLLGRLWLALVRAGSVAWRMNLLSAVTQAAAVGVLALAVRRATRSAAAGVLVALTWAVTGPAWKYALVAEVFPLGNLMAALLLYGAACALEGSRRGLALVVLITALIPAHHHALLILALPAAGVMAWRAWHDPALRPAGRHGARAAGLVLLGLSPLLYLPLAAARHPPLNWGDPGTPAAFLRLLLRAEYGTFSLAPEAARLTADRSHGLLYLEALARDFSPLLLVALLGGLVMLRRRPALAALCGGAALLQALFFLRVAFPTTPPLYLGVVERFYMLPHLLAAAVAGGGLAAFFRWPPVARLGAPARAAGWLLLAALLVVVPAAGRFRVVDQRGNTFVADFGRNVLASLPPQAVLFSRGDLYHNSLVYLLYVEQARPDITFVDQELLTRAWYVADWRRRAPDLLPPFPAGRYTGDDASANVNWLDHLIDRRPVAFIGTKEASYAARYDLYPRGFVEMAAPHGQAPDIAAQAETAARLLGDWRLDSTRRAYDPWSSEADSRGLVTAALTRACLLLCQPGAYALTPAAYPGLARLGQFLARYGRDEAHPDPALLRAAGLLALYHPTFRNPAQARADLGRYLATGPTGPEADEARAALAALGGARGPRAGAR